MTETVKKRSLLMQPDIIDEETKNEEDVTSSEGEEDKIATNENEFGMLK